MSINLDEVHSFEEVLRIFPDSRILVIGDVMLDRFVYGEVKRISPEAPAAVINAEVPEEIVGGAANAAINIASLGAQCELIGVVGQDSAATVLEKLLENRNVRASFVRTSKRCTTVKMRFVANLHNTHMLRADWEDSSALDPELEDELLRRIKAAVAEADGVLISDYAKGVLTPRILEYVFETARDQGKPVVVDPKGNNFGKYKGVTTLTPNVSEVCDAVGRKVANEDQSLVEAGRQILSVTDADFLLITRSEKGILIVEKNGSFEGFPATGQKVIDVSGAGDTLAASFLLALVSGAGHRNAARLANIAAGIIVGLRGTATIPLAELKSALLSRIPVSEDTKVFGDWADLVVRVDEWRREGLTVGFTNGCFDLVHPGHVHALKSARALCDRLVVGINSDASVQRLKGPTRPIQSQDARAIVLSAFGFVDAVAVFDEQTPLSLIQAVKPTVLVKGADYTASQVVGKEFVESYGGRVELISLVPDASTSNLVKRAQAPVERKSVIPPYHLMIRAGKMVTAECESKLKQGALFLDRDGVVNVDTGYVGRVADLRIINDTAAMIAEFNRAGIPVVLVSNQSGVSRGYFDWPAVCQVDDAVASGLSDHGAHLDLVLYSGAHAELAATGSDFRKPAPGMFFTAAKLLAIDLSRSVLIGDKISDLEAAAAAGLIRGILIAPEGNSEELGKLNSKFPLLEAQSQSEHTLALTEALNYLSAVNSL